MTPLLGPADDDLTKCQANAFDECADCPVGVPCLFAVVDRLAAPRTERGDTVRRYANIDGPYRYWLERDWWERDRARGTIDLLAFVMLNPSTADGEVDDPTIRRCIGFAKREGAHSMHVMNLYALRATDPAELLTHPDPVGVGNDEVLRSIARYHDRFKTVVAWGAHKMATAERVSILTDAARAAGTELWCLGKTKSGAPRHPLYVKADAPLEPFAPAVPDPSSVDTPDNRTGQT